MHELFLKFVKFSLVGGSGVVVDFSITYLFKEKLKQNQYLANSLGFMTAASSNYLLNRIWTFTSENQNVSAEYLVFIVTSVIGLLINNIVIWLLNEKFHINFYVSKLGAIGVAMIWNFLANYSITFNASSVIYSI